MHWETRTFVGFILLGYSLYCGGLEPKWQYLWGLLVQWEIQYVLYTELSSFICLMHFSLLWGELFSVEIKSLHFQWRKKSCSQGKCRLRKANLKLDLVCSLHSVTSTLYQCQTPKSTSSQKSRVRREKFLPSKREKWDL